MPPRRLLYERFGLHGLVSANSRSYLAACLAECGAFAEGRALAEEGGRIAAAADHPYSRVVADWALGFQTLRQGDLLQAIPVLERALGLAHETPIRLLMPLVVASLGAAYALAERIAEALALLEQVVEQAMAMHFLSIMRCAWSGWARRICWPAGWTRRRPRRSGRWSSPGLTRSGAMQPTPCGSWVPSQRSARRGKALPAAAHYHQALALAEALGMRPLQAHCHRDLGTLYATAGQQEQARAAYRRLWLCTSRWR